MSKMNITSYTKIGTKMLVIPIVTFSTYACFNVLGIFLLTKAKPKPDNQRMILINMTLSSLLVGVCYACPCVKAMVNSKALYESFSPVELFIACFTIFSYKLLVIYLTLDRLFAIWCNIYYPIYFTSACVKKIVIGIWIGSLIIGAICTVTLNFLVLQNIDRLLYFMYTYMAFDMAIIINVFLSYSYMFWRAKQLHRNTSQMGQSSEADRNARFLVPFLLCLSYIVFNVTGDILVHIGLTSLKGGNKDTSLLFVGDIFYFFGYFSDILICVIFQREVRQFCMKLCRCNKSLAANDIRPQATSTPNNKETTI